MTMHQPVPATERSHKAPCLRIGFIAPALWLVTVDGEILSDDESLVEYLPKSFMCQRAAEEALIAARFAEADLHRIVMGAGA
jgi:hypothetical protein